MTDNSATEAAAGKADIVERLADRDSIVMGGMFTAIPLLHESRTEIASLRERVKELTANSEVERLLRIALAQDRFAELKEWKARAETAERVFTDVCDELGCKHDNEAALEAVAELKRRLAKATEALERLIYETTHLSPERDDGSHDCRISKEALTAARAITEEK